MHSANASMPGLPGAHKTSSTDALRVRPHTSECSRPPDPRTRTRTAQAARGSTTHWSRAGPTDTNVAGMPASSWMRCT